MISALLYKDVIVLWKQSKILLLIMVVFLGIGAIQLENDYFLIYPAVALCTMSINSLSYDEKFGWNRYADALPYGRRRIVTAKYLLSLLSTAAAAALYLAVGVLGGIVRHNLSMGDMLSNLFALLTIATVYTVILLPLSFRFGMEKARIAYIIVICTVIVVALNIYAPKPGFVPPASLDRYALDLFALPFYGLLWVISWGISVRLYQKKEL